MPKVSVIVAVYNVEKYIKECLDSLVNQTLKDIEIICVDDKSTDKSLEILKEYAHQDNRIVILEQDKNQGQGAARNRGLDVAQGEFLTFVDADDYLDVTFCEIMYEKIKQENTDLIVCNIENFIDENAICTEELILQKKSEDDYRNWYMIPAGRHDYDFSNQKRIIAGPVLKLYPKALIDKYNIRFPEGLIQEDEGFYWFYMTRINSLYVLDLKLYKRRIHSQSTMYNLIVKTERVLDYLRILEFVYEFLKKNKLSEKYKRVFRQTVINGCNNILYKNLKNADKETKRCVEREVKKLKYKVGILKYTDSIFSMKNSGAYKIITILGIKIKIRRAERA